MSKRAGHKKLAGQEWVVRTSQSRTSYFVKGDNGGRREETEIESWSVNENPKAVVT
jgi:hypothetical protein